MRSAVATMIGRGWSDSAIKLACAPYCDDGANDADLKTLIDTGRGKFEKSDTEGTATLPHGYSFSDRGLMWQDPNPPAMATPSHSCTSPVFSMSQQ
jgi:hypothetical protein